MEQSAVAHTAFMTAAAAIFMAIGTGIAAIGAALADGANAIITGAFLFIDHLSSPLFISPRLVFIIAGFD